MSKNLTRKGLALGTALSFALAGLSALPASADDAGLVTLMPSAGKTFNALSGDGVTTGTTAQGIILKAKVDADISDASAAKLAYLIANPGRVSLTIDSLQSDGSTDVAEAIYSVVGGVKGSTDLTAATNAANLVVLSDTAGATAKSAGETLKIQSAKEANLTVQSFIDKDEDGVLDAGEAASKAEAVNLYDPKNVAVSAVVDENLKKGDGVIGVKLTFGKSVNADQVTESVYGIAVYKDGQAATLATTRQVVENAHVTTAAKTADYALSADLERVAQVSTDSVGRMKFDVDQGLAIVAGANYSVRVAYLAHASNKFLSATANGGSAVVTLDLTKVVWAGSRSASAYIPEGTDTTVNDLVISVADTKNTKDDADGSTTLKARSGQKTVKFTAQARKTGTSGAANYASSNVRVKAVLKVKVATTSAKFSIEGSSDVLSKVDETAVVYGRTDADGKYSVTVTSTTAAATDKYEVKFYYLKSDSVWTAITEADASVTYEDAKVTTFKAVSNILAGSTVNAEFKVLDQFKQPISKDADGSALNVYLADSDTTKLKKTAAVSNGKATISFANYLTKGDSSVLNVKLYVGTDSDNTVSGVTVPDVTLYNPEATGAVIVNAKETNKITYSPFVLGDPSADADEDTVAPLADDALPFKGRVEDANGAGLPAAVVTISGKGLQFEDKSSGTASGEYFKDSITVVADASGDFNVNVWNHYVGKTTVTVTSGGKSASSVLTGTFNYSSSAAADVALNDVTSGTELIKVTWNVQKHPAVNGTYIVQAIVSDKWNNALKGAEVTFTADGALEVNGKEEVKRTTTATGKATIYMGTVTGAKGFGNITATVTSVHVDRNADGDLTDANETIKISDEENLVLSADLIVGTDATAAASTSKGLVKASVYNATGKTVQVYVSGKLVATKKATSASYSFNVKAAKGAKKVTVKVAGSTYFSDVITVK